MEVRLLTNLHLKVLVSLKKHINPPGIEESKSYTIWTLIITWVEHTSLTYIQLWEILQWFYSKTNEAFSDWPDDIIQMEVVPKDCCQDSMFQAKKSAHCGDICHDIII